MVVVDRQAGFVGLYFFLGNCRCLFFCIGIFKSLGAGALRTTQSTLRSGSVFTVCVVVGFLAVVGCREGNEPHQTSGRDL